MSPSILDQRAELSAPNDPRLNPTSGNADGRSAGERAQAAGPPVPAWGWPPGRLPPT